VKEEIFQKFSEQALVGLYIIQDGYFVYVNPKFADIFGYTNGCGIPKEQLKNIFIPSFTLKGDKDATGSYKTGIKGTGYGLSNVKKYIEQHNGNISIKSVFGSGTKFTISMPVKELEIK